MTRTSTIGSLLNVTGSDENNILFRKDVLTEIPSNSQAGWVSPEAGATPQQKIDLRYACACGRAMVETRALLESPYVVPKHRTFKLVSMTDQEWGKPSWRPVHLTNDFIYNMHMQVL